MDISYWLALLSLLSLLATLFGCIEVTIGGLRLRALRDMAALPDAELPRLSIVLSALDEAETIVPALQSMLALDYPALEIIVINDRSTDATPQLLERLAAQDARLKVLHVHALPAGWLGKNHALHLGAARAAGDYLLFTDADVVFHPQALRRAVSHCRRERLDHLTVFPDVVAPGGLLAMLMLNFGINFMLRFKPWKIRESSGHFLGMGAFNLVRAEAYRAAGGHAALRMQVLDDLMLGKLMKRCGHAQDVLIGRGMLSIAWYRNAGQMFRGLEKNFFAGFDYRLSLLVAATLLLGVRIWPWIGLLATDGVAWWMNAAGVAVLAAWFAGAAITAGLTLRCLLYLPVVDVISLAMLWRACLLTLRRGGIVWRGTFYPLAELRAAGTLSGRAD